MSAYEYIHPEQLKIVAGAHGDKFFPNFRDNELRNKGCCYDYSEHFSRWSGLKGAMVKGYDLEGDQGAHAINVVPTSQGPHAVDFTYNQFDQSTPVPVVEPLHQYEARVKKNYPKLKGYEPYKYEGDINLDETPEGFNYQWWGHDRPEHHYDA